MLLITARDAAVILNVSVPRVYRLSRAGIIPAVRLGRQLRFSQTLLEQFFADGGKTLPGGWRVRRDG